MKCNGKLVRNSRSIYGYEIIAEDIQEVKELQLVWDVANDFNGRIQKIISEREAIIDSKKKMREGKKKKKM